MVDDWARFSEAEDNLTFGSSSAPSTRPAPTAVIAAMEAAGMTARIDAIGNVVGRYEGG